MEVGRSWFASNDQLSGILDHPTSDLGRYDDVGTL